jgi:hypothetical protein
MSRYLDRNIRRCTGVLRHVQILTHYCLREVLQERHSPLPNLMRMFKDIQLGTWAPPVVPGLEPPTPRVFPMAPAVAPPDRAANRVHAPAGDLDWDAVPHIANFRPTDFIKTHGVPPANDKGTPMCLRYHVIGFCETTCARAADHRKHSKADTSRLVTYMGTALP